MKLKGNNDVITDNKASESVLIETLTCFNYLKLAYGYVKMGEDWDKEKEEELWEG